MRARTFTAALPVALAVLITAAGCARKEPEAPAQTAAPPESAAPAPAAAPAPEAAAAPAAAPAPEAAPAPAAAPTAAAAPAAAPASAAAGNAAGAKVFKMYCETCHGAAGKGDGIAAAALKPKPANFATGAFKYDANGNGTKGDIDDIKAIVHDGAAKHGGSPLMTPWSMLSADQLQAVAQHVKSLHGG